jgi:hypothetical protein
MTREQFSQAVDADNKWVENSARLLGRSLRYDESEARWMGLVRILVRDLGIPLSRAATIADRAMMLPRDARSVKVQKNSAGSLQIVLDLARYHSTHAVNVSLALNHGERRKVGRPPRVRLPANGVTPGTGLEAPRSPQQRLEIMGASFGWMLARLKLADIKFVVVGGLAAVAAGSNKIPDSLEICYESSSENIAALAKLLKKWKGYPRGIGAGLPFLMNKRQLKATPVITLATYRGSIDVFGTVKGVGGYAECKRRSTQLEAFEIPLNVLKMEAVIESKRASGNSREQQEVAELEGLIKQ